MKKKKPTIAKDEVVRRETERKRLIKEAPNAYARVRSSDFGRLNTKQKDTGQVVKIKKKKRKR